MVGAGHARRGQLWEYVAGSRRYRVVIVSGDEYNALPGATPWGLAVVPASDGPPGSTVPLRQADLGTSGSIVVPYVMRCDPSALRHCFGFVSDETYQELEQTLRDFLELP